MSTRHPSGGHRVAVTGIGVKSPAGNTLEEVYTALLAGRSAATRLDRLVEADLPVHFACLVPPFDVTAHLSPREARQIDRPAQLLLCAAADALADARLPADRSPDRIGVQIGTGIGGLTSMEDATTGYATRPRDLPVHTVPRTMSNSPACRIALRHGFQGVCTTYSSACASGSTALAEAARRIRHGELDVAVAGGVDSAVSTVVMGAFARMRALSTRNDAPALASRPFDADRDGFVMGEGAAVLVLERLDAARARGAVVHGEIAGWAETCDAFHIAAPHEAGEVAGRCMRQAVADAGLSVADIGHISAHGTSTVPGDRAEARAVDRCFDGQSPPVTAVKGVTGHLIGAAGALEAALALVCAARGTVPPIANLGSSPEAHWVDLVHGAPRKVAPAPVLSNSFGFGGQNACLVLAPPP
ncbi:beta-ketoacyl synthase [Kitasatospora sp. CB02891]|uniref:beta-ketoacyl-[acyl-carrier-protein] synthase family protein n=1 Tax=Kitasatospora sp. CB02891 TaxID=2020329 RepID=UPI000C27C7BB|nr:beta-ketoacyl-[acyl-carrier-protein] synthase family protein [Kitasatospora sp. CB02891]PJN25555.1 3-oxoacyl-ACP synthase [Kitasatospora sp. CB02891]